MNEKFIKTNKIKTKQNWLNLGLKSSQNRKSI